MTKHEAVLWRRDKVQELLIKGYNQTRIAKELQVSTYAISNDVKQLNYQAKESMKEHLEHRLPLEFTHCIQGINEVLRDVV
jgi:Trp operon repressor